MVFSNLIFDSGNLKQLAMKLFLDRLNALIRALVVYFYQIMLSLLL